MQQPIEEILEKYFSEYEQYHKYALLSIIIIIAAFQIWQAVIVSKKIEKFKNDLKRSEIKFSRFQNMQIDALKAIYDQIVTFHYANHRLINLSVFTHESLKSHIIDWDEQGSKFIDFIHRERILMPPNLVNEFKEFETVMRKISTRLGEESLGLKSLEDDYQTDDVQTLYGNYEDEVASVKQRWTKLMINEDVKNSEDSFHKVRKSVEKYFGELIN